MPALTRDRILAEAIAFADAEGVEALSMRKLSERLGVGAMSLYRHVANKDEMLDGMVDAVCAELQPPRIVDDWREAIRTTSAEAHAALLAHPWAAGEWSRRRPGPARVAYMDALLRVLTEAGLRPDLIYRGYHAITMHLVGFTIQELSYRNGLAGQDLAVVAGQFLDGLDDGHLRHLADHVRAHLDGEDHGDEFGFVLDLILDGLHRANSTAG
ncbi:MAG: TetR/AcrR family transcriptional regulator [Actinomycetota bacterium]